MMKKLLVLILLLLAAGYGKSQPGWAYMLAGNLNEMDSAALKTCEENPELCQMGTVVIDSSTDLSRLVHLTHMSSLQLEIQLPAIPEEFSNLRFEKLTNLVIYGKHTLKSLKNLKNMPQLRQLTISEFSGREIDLDLATFPGLTDLVVFSSPELHDLEKLLVPGQLVRLYLADCPSLENIGNAGATPYEHLRYLTLIKVSPNLLEELTYMTALESLSLSHVLFEAVPGDLPLSLKNIYIGYNDLLKDDAGLQRLTGLKSIHLAYNGTFPDRKVGVN